MDLPLTLLASWLPRYQSIENRAKSGVPKPAHCARVGGARIGIWYAYEAESPENSESLKQSRLRPLLGGQN